jgi:hypothetical protein
MDAFWQAVAEHDWQQPNHILEFRLYYNEHGEVLCYSMEDLPGNYISIDRQTFDQARVDILVKHGKIIKISNPISWKLAPANEENYACHAQDVTVIVPVEHEQRKFWKVKTTHEAN